MVSRLRYGSFFYLLFVTSAVILIPFVIWCTLLEHREHLTILAITVGVALVSGVLYLITGPGVRCPLCLGSVLGKSGATRSRKGSRLFGSYRVGVSLRVLTIGHYRCPCCGEPCKCESAR